MAKGTIGKATMEQEKLLAALEEVAEKIGVRIRYENLTGGPIRATHGSCRIRDEKVILIDRRLGVLEKLHALSRELRSFDLGDVFISPAVRKFLKIESE
jgi:hypothetical protein